MIRVRDVRFATALAVMGLSAATLVEGLSLARYGLAEALATPADAEARLRPFVSDPVVGAKARLDLLRLAPSDPTHRADDLVQLLSVAPLNGGAWLDLAIARRASSQPADSVATALAMSTLTWPNEALTMAGRVQFAAPFWSILPPDVRRALIEDVVSGWPAIDEKGRARLATIWGADVDGPHEDIRAALLTHGAPGPQIAAALFPPPAAAPVSGEAR